MNLRRNSFVEYVNILKKHFKRKISNEELCGILFDAIIEPLDLKNCNGEILTIDKAEVSRIMNGKKNIPTALYNHVYDEEVIDSINEYFLTNIVAELVPDTSDLCYQMMKLIDKDENISPYNKNKLRLLANSKSKDRFLAEAFIYSLRQDNKKLTPVNADAQSEIVTLVSDVYMPQPDLENIYPQFERKHISYPLIEIDEQSIVKFFAEQVQLN